ncbi:MAG TPA: hypothetical protein ENJ32_04905 [Crenotrichaceae bacterium]|nr:hypothetical protein [Crenotrichaceae bacterium]
MLEQTLDQWEFDSAHLMIGKGHLPLNNTTKYSLKAHLHEWDLQELQTIQTFISELHFEQPQSTENNAQSADLTIDIDIDQLTLAETRLGSVSLALKKRNPDWYGKIGGSVATGTFSYIPGTESDTKNLTPHRGEINLNLETFNVVDTSSLTKAQTSITNDDSLAFLPDQFPAMIITVDQLVWDDFDMGKLFLETSTIENGLLIDTFTINSTQHQFSASGQWVTHESMMETHLKGMLQSKNMGHILNKFGIYEDIRKTAAKIDFNLGWQASPFLIDWQSLGGKISFKLKHGRLLGVEPGIGRALGLFSLSAWERRLRFDFSDVVNKGFAYDNVDVEFALFNGNAYSANFKIDGVAARVNFAGRIGLLAKDIDAVVTVIPRSSIALPLVGAAGGPIGIGAGLVMQQVIGNQFETLSSSEYTITGQWTNPKITLVPENGGIFTRMLWELQKITGIQDSTAQ